MSNYSRIFSSLSPSARLHLGHYHNTLLPWKTLQYEHDCYFMIADIHALNQNLEDDVSIKANITEILIDCLAAGIDPVETTIFIQSKVPEHYELATLLASITPLSWLERSFPRLKDSAEFAEHVSYTYGLLGHGLLQSADILLYDATFFPNHDDNLTQIELAREIARRFNHIYGRELGFEQKAIQSIKKLGSKKAEIYQQMLVRYQQNGDDEALERARFMLQDAPNLSNGERTLLFAFLENKSKVTLQEPQVLNNQTPVVFGTDGRKMFNSYKNTINLRENSNSVSKKIKEMLTDSARVRRIDPGEPDRCPVWKLHQIYSESTVKEWVVDGCRSAKIGCLDCKGPLIDAINHEQKQLIENAKPYQSDPNSIKRIISDGCDYARGIAGQTIKQVKQAMNIDY